MEVQALSQPDLSLRKGKLGLPELKEFERPERLLGVPHKPKKFAKIFKKGVTGPVGLVTPIVKRKSTRIKKRKRTKK